MLQETRGGMKISLSYTGQFSNSISTKEDKLMHSNLVKDWRNGFQLNIPLSGSFTLFDVLNVNPTFNFHRQNVHQQGDALMG